MDLSSLPLMPSMDLPPAVEAPVPEAARPYAGSSWDTAAMDDLGCSCPSCRELRERDRSASSMRQQYGSAVPTPASMEWVVPPSGDFFDASTPWVAGAFGSAVTGRISASQPAMANIPRAGIINFNTEETRRATASLFEQLQQPAAIPRQAPTMAPRRIRGRYDFSESLTPASGLHGQVRWREPGTLQVWDSSTDGHSQWTYVTELPDGTLVDRNGNRWRPTEV